MRVLLLEAGSALSPEADHFDENIAHTVPGILDGAGIAPQVKQRQAVQALCPAYNERSHKFFVDDIDHPYSVPETKQFAWIRSRQVGGRTILWGRQCYRMSDFEFKAAARDGFGEDWPISYSDLAPYYDKVETFMGVHGSYEHLPQLPDGRFLPPLALSAGEQLLKIAVETKWPQRKVIPMRIAGANSPDGGGSVWPYFSSPGSTLAAAGRTGKLELQPNSITSHILVDSHSGKAKGVGYVDRDTKQAYEAFGKVILLCASTIESTRILLNSATRQHPGGLGNSADVLGHYLMDHTGCITVTGVGPPRSPVAGGNESAMGIYMPNFRNLDGPEMKFLRGYGIQGGVQRGIPGLGHSQLPGSAADSSWDRKNSSDSLSGDSQFWLAAFGEMLPRFHNRVTLNQDEKDAWGIPTVHIDCTHSDNERAMARDQVECLTEMAEAAGFQIMRKQERMAQPGLSIHEVGTARMGADPGKSVVDPFNACWDADNVFVLDGACFVSQGYQNPTLTMMAIAVRACAYIIDQLKKGNI